MTNKKIDIIGAGFGWGAQLHETQNGPQALKNFGIIPSDWRCLLSPHVLYDTHKKLNYSDRLDQVISFNEKLANTVIESFQENNFPVVLGGDHSIAMGTWSGIVAALNAPERFGLIWVDAHMDSHTIQTTPSQAIHGMPLAVLLGYGERTLVDMLINGPKLAPQHVVLIGVRSYESGEAELLEKLNVRIYYMDEVKSRGFQAVFNEAIERVSHGTKGFGISIDLDGFDPSIAPGVGTPEPNGLYAEEVCAALSKLSQHEKFKALEIVEYNPTKDKNNMTTKIVQDLILSVDQSKTHQWIAQEKIHCANNYHPIPVVLTKGEGVWLWDIEGKRYLDMMSAYSAVSFGHSHPQLLKVLNEQAKTLCVTSRAYHTDTLKPYLDKLCQLTMMDMAMPLNTGVEAVEAAIKAARKWGYEKKGILDNKAEIIVAAYNFHGRTTTVISFSSDELYKKHFGPLTPGFKEIPFGDVEALKRAITPNTCAFLVEPIQGESGIVIPPKGWLKACEQVCKKNNVLLIVDEVQSGLGRTGALFAFEHENVQPDGLILGKALGGGILPVSAFLAKKELMEVFIPGTHGSTFGGNPLASRIALEVLRILEDGDLVEQSAALGDYLLRELQAIKNPLIKEVRGQGLWVGMEVDMAKISARTVCEVLMRHGILTKETHDSVIRFAPPLTIDKETLKWAISEVEKTLEECLKNSDNA